MLMGPIAAAQPIDSLLTSCAIRASLLFLIPAIGETIDRGSAASSDPDLIASFAVN